MEYLVLWEKAEAETEAQKSWEPANHIPQHLRDSFDKRLLEATTNTSVLSSEDAASAAMITLRSGQKREAAESADPPARSRATPHRPPQTLLPRTPLSPAMKLKRLSQLLATKTMQTLSPDD